MCRSAGPCVVTVNSSSPAALEEAVSLLLDRHWDPIGLYGHEGDEAPEPGPSTADTPPGRRHAPTRRDTPSISHYLVQQATQSMGVGPGPTRTVAEALHAWWNTDDRRLPIAP